MSLPARSSRTKVKPPAVPTPGIDGGEKANAAALGDLVELPRSGGALIAS